MKNIKSLILITFGIILLSTTNNFSQKGKGHHHNGRSGNQKAVGHHHHGNKKLVVVRSPYRPNTIVVYHPHWGPKRNYNRRWVYFPRHNFYWDNWRQLYVYKNGAVWITNTTRPPVVANVNIENEKHYELKETEDDLDDVYSTNPSHQTEYKPE